jgi:hypothetical protein
MIAGRPTSDRDAYLAEVARIEAAESDPAARKAALAAYERKWSSRRERGCGPPPCRSPRRWRRSSGRRTFQARPSQDRAGDPEIGAGQRLGCQAGRPRRLPRRGRPDRGRLLRLVDRLGGGADHLDAELFKHAHPLERQRAVQRRWPTPRLPSGPTATPTSPRSPGSRPPSRTRPPGSVAKEAAVLRLVDRLGGGADHLDAELFKHAHPLERTRIRRRS